MPAFSSRRLFAVPIVAAVGFTLAIAAPFANSASAGPPTVVELYQSQGCSSCPPANENILTLTDRPDPPRPQLRRQLLGSPWLEGHLRVTRKHTAPVRLHQWRPEAPLRRHAPGGHQRPDRHLLWRCGTRSALRSSSSQAQSSGLARFAGERARPRRKAVTWDLERCAVDAHGLGKCVGWLPPLWQSHAERIACGVFWEIRHDPYCASACICIGIRCLQRPSAGAGRQH